MDPRLQKRIMLFYLAGVINAILGVYVVIEGRAFLPAENVRWLALFFFAFAAVDFWFPRVLKRKWSDMQAQAAAKAASAKNQGKATPAGKG
jgi:protein-S-isoprenylcysteine O-methyltransferase Ste14